MVTIFDRWEKDPFFAAAEEVQESADRMESAYRAWVHAKKDLSSIWNSEELQRDLRTALGTTKWQLDEFERAVQSSYRKSLSEDSVARHREFSVAIEEQISKIEKSLHETARSEGNTSMRWVHLDQHESDELALFLVGTCPTEDGKITSRSYHPEINECLQDVDRKTVVDFSKAPSPSVQWGSEEDTTNRKSNGHRRTASAHAGIETWTIAINDDGQQTSSDSSAPQRPRRVPSFSGLLNYTETTTNLKWTRNGVRKLKSTDRHEECETESRPSSDLTRGIDACYERSKSCLDCDDCYDKQLSGWYGAIHRQLQRSQYQMQYGRPVRVIIWMFILLSMIAATRTRGGYWPDLGREWLELAHKAAQGLVRVKMKE